MDRAVFLVFTRIQSRFFAENGAVIRHTAKRLYSKAQGTRSVPWVENTTNKNTESVLQFARDRYLVPRVSFVDVHVVFSANPAKFLLKSFGPVVVFLIGDVMF